MVSGTEPDSLERYRQKRRRPRKPRDTADRPISHDVDRAYDLVPEIGEGLRWYDMPYRLLMWGSSGWRRKILPRRLQHAANTGINYLLPYNEHDRDFVWPVESRRHNVFAPEDDHVKTAGLWVIELFPPSQLPAFEKALHKNGWKRSRWWDPHQDDNTELLRQSRSGQGASWWRVVDALQRDSKSFVLDRIRMDLPHEFDVISVRAINVGAGLTAALAHFSLTDAAASALDVEWHRKREPILLPRERGRRRQSLDRQSASYHQTQLARKGMHETARRWMSESLPGFFAEHDASQFLLELLLFDEFDPTQELHDDIDREAAAKRSDALRALGVSDRAPHHIVSPSLPKLVLSPNDKLMHPTLGNDPTWTLWGRTTAIAEALADEHVTMSGGDPERAISHEVERTHNLLVMLAVSEMVAVNEARYAEIRDRASTRHGKFQPKALRELRRSFLTLSLDLSTVRRDVASFWDNEFIWKVEGGGDFEYQRAPWLKVADEKAGRPHEEREGFNRRVRKLQNQRFDALAAADRDYREILATVASLGASIDASKLGRRALWVALVSLVVAVTTIVLADVGCNSLVHEVIGWPSSGACPVP